MGSAMCAFIFVVGGCCVVFLISTTVIRIRLDTVLYLNPVQGSHGIFTS